MVINLSIRLSLPKSPIKISFEHLTEVEQRMALYVATLYSINDTTFSNARLDICAMKYAVAIFA